MKMVQAQLGTTPTLTMFRTLTIIAFTFGLHICNSLSNNDTLQPVIETTLGKVRGVRSFVTNQPTPVDKFLGIPYAQPPLAERRFKRPMMANPWSGIKDTVEHSNACYQSFQMTGFHGDDMWIPTVPISEDCLYLNIWVPRNNQETMTNLSVLVWIYGGSFITGSADLDVYDGTLLAAIQNVIVVSMNYRVGPFGFLYLGSSSAPGNMGLMDQQLALKWIFQNIQSFGGDPRKISIFGESAGSASVSYHLLSPESWDYFSSAIMESGTALSPWAFRSPSDSMDLSKDYAEAVQCSSDNTDEVVKCLIEKSTEDLLNQQAAYLFFTPTIDGEFIDKPPDQLLREKRFKRCNIMMGYNTDEQAYFMAFLQPSKFGRNQQEPPVSSTELKEYINRVSLASVPPLSNSTLLLDSAIYVYVDSVPQAIRGSNYDVLDDIVGDYDFKCPVVHFAEAYAAENLDVYFYHFDHRSPTNPWPEWMGVMHGYEIEFVFGIPHNGSLGYSPADKGISDVMMSYWANFASEGDPNHATSLSSEEFWPNFTTTQQRYKHLKADLLETKQFPRYKECSFRRDFIPILERYSRPLTVRCPSTATRKYAASVSILLCLLYPVLITFSK